MCSKILNYAVSNAGPFAATLRTCSLIFFLAERASVDVGKQDSVVVHPVCVDVVHNQSDLAIGEHGSGTKWSGDATKEGEQVVAHRQGLRTTA